MLSCGQICEFFIAIFELESSSSDRHCVVLQSRYLRVISWNRLQIFVLSIRSLWLDTALKNSGLSLIITVLRRYWLTCVGHRIKVWGLSHVGSSTLIIVWRSNFWHNRPGFRIRKRVLMRFRSKHLLIIWRVSNILIIILLILSLCIIINLWLRHRRWIRIHSLIVAGYSNLCLLFSTFFKSFFCVAHWVQSSPVW